MTVFSAAARRAPRASSGFTLIELMIVVVIIAILSAMAMYAYTGYVARAQRADARNQLLQAAQFMQRFYSANDSYMTDRTNKPVAGQIPASLNNSPADSTPIYTLSVPALTALTYTLVMTPVAGGPRANDSCGAFSVTSTGVRGISTSTDQTQRDICWK